MACQAEIIQLVNFIAILQLLAGLCLLFFYEDLLTRITVTPARTGCIEYLDQVMNYLQAEFANEDLDGIYGILDCKRDTEGFITIPSLRNAISYCGKLAFVFLIALMIVASHESVDEKSGIGYGWLFVSTVTFICLVIWSLIHRKDVKYNRYWNFKVSAFILCGIVFLTVPLSFEMPFSKTLTTYAIVASIPICVSIIICFFRFDERRAEKLSRDLEQLRNAVASYRNWAVSPNNNQRYFKIDPSLRHLFPLTASQSEAQKVIENYVRKRVHTLKETYSGYNLIFHNPSEKITARMGNAITAPRVLAAKIIAILLIVLYVIVIIQLDKTLH